MKPGYYKDISNADYHAGPGVSKSQLDLVAKAPALLPWSKNAPEDEEKKTALNLGTAVHTMLLEPEKFSEQFMVAPAFNARTNEGKAQKAEFEAMVKASGRTVLTADESRKINLMFQSVMANPEARKLMEADGDCEASGYWEDPETGVLCRCRPDKFIPSADLIVDVKTTADINKFRFSVRDFRYDVQDAFYSGGMRSITGNDPRFLFLVVSSSIECGKYPVRIFELTDERKQLGHEKCRQDLTAYAECLQTDTWPGVEYLD